MSEKGLPAGKRWAIVLSARAVKELRKIERDQKALEIVHNKMRELSSGDFSQGNHRIIEGTRKHVPMFRARVPFDLRIIYQIDVLPDATGKYDHQVIKIFQIRSRARVDYDFWVKVSRCLKRTNPKYLDRCQCRQPPKNPTNDAQPEYRPVMFPHEEYGLGVPDEDTEFLSELTEEERDQIQEITMDRFAPFNKALYNSIRADLEMVLPMVLDEHERAIVSHKGASIVVGRSGTGKTTALIYKIRAVDQENAANEDGQPTRQLFVTRSRVLAQHVEATYRGLEEFTNIASKSEAELKEMARKSRQDPDRALVEFDTEVDLRSDLPPRFSDLNDSHFPLFISFDKLCSLLEGDIRHSVPGQIDSEKNRSLIQFGDFLHGYWPSFRGHTHGLEPNLVWSEILGVIKGSQAAYNSKEGYLSRTEYVEGLSQRQFSLLAHIRANVYSIFELYTKRKTARFHTDDADRTRIILHNLPKILQRPDIDYLYVDEVQDNLMIDIYLLRRLAKSIENIYWSGDSAQTVVAGSSFRINDLKAFTYQDQLATPSPYSSRRPITTPQFTMFDLNVNFRSLSGIVRFGRFVVEAIHNLFPQAIDVMEPEKAKQYGDPPVLFTNIQSQEGYFEEFLLGSSASNRVVFGAQQAILVRDAEAAEELDARLQGLCNVIPIMDSKGLEFDDVLIYNFFSKSPAPVAAWEYISGTTRWNQAPPPVLCSELKLLYVAVTRTRRRCWIWDSGPIITKLMAIWISQGLIDTEPATRMVGRLAVSSSKAQWSSKGREYFSHRLYKLAAACFRQAEQINDAKLSAAYHLMSRAKLKRLRGDTLESREELAVAATELVKCAELSGIGDPKNIYFHAATCFQDAQKLLPAAAALVQAGQAKEGIEMLFEARDYKSAANILYKNREIIESNVFNELREQARIHLFEHSEYSSIGYVFDSDDEKIAYARQKQYRTQLKHILAQLGRFHELAEEFLLDRDLEETITCFVKAYQTHQTHASIIRAVELAISYTESILLVEGIYHKKDQDLAKSLVEKVQPFASRTERESYLKIDLFYAYLCSDYVNIEMIRAWNQTNLTHRSMRLLASYLAIKNNSWLREESLGVLLEYLGVLESYKAEITQIIKAERPCTLPSAQKLLGFTPTESSSSRFKVLKGSLLGCRTSKAALRSEIWLPGNHIDAIIKEELPKRLNSLVESWHSTALALPHIQPHHPISIPQYSKFGAGPNDSSMAKLHVISKLLGVLNMTGHIRVESQCDYTIAQHLWLGRMFEIIYISTGELVPVLPWGQAPGFRRNSVHLRSWLARDWKIICASDYSANSITHILLHFLVRSSLQGILSEHSDAPFALKGTIKDHELKTALMVPFHEFCFMRATDRIHQAVGSIKHILDKGARPDAAVLVHSIEFLMRDFMVFMNPSGCPAFDGLLLPFSWAQDLAHKYKDVSDGCSIKCFSEFCTAIEQVSAELCFGMPEPWSFAGNPITPTVVDVLNLRLCWCIALAIGHMDPLDENLPLALETLRKISSDEMPLKCLHRYSTAAGTYHIFTKVNDQQAAHTALRQTFRHESLILVLKDAQLNHPAKLMVGVHTIVCSDPTELADTLDKFTHSSSPSVLDEEPSDSNFTPQTGPAEEHLDAVGHGHCVFPSRENEKSSSDHHGGISRH